MSKKNLKQKKTTDALQENLDQEEHNKWLESLSDKQIEEKVKNLSKLGLIPIVEKKSK